MSFLDGEITPSHTIIGFLTIIVLIVIIAKVDNRRKKSDAENSEETEKQIKISDSLGYFILKFENRKRAIDDSTHLIQNSNNLDVIISQYQEAKEIWGWISEHKEMGYPISIQEEEEGFLSSLTRSFNFNIARVASYHTEKFQNEIHKLKSKSAIEYRFIKHFKFLKQCEDSIIDHYSKSPNLKKIEELHFKTEEWFSDFAAIPDDKYPLNVTEKIWISADDYLKNCIHGLDNDPRSRRIYDAYNLATFGSSDFFVVNKFDYEYMSKKHQEYLSNKENTNNKTPE